MAAWAPSSPSSSRAEPPTPTAGTPNAVWKRSCIQPKGIPPVHGVVFDIGIGVETPQQTEQIPLNEAAEERSVVARAVVIEASDFCLPASVLHWVAAGRARAFRPAERFIGIIREQGTGRIGDRQGIASNIGEESLLFPAHKHLIDSHAAKVVGHEAGLGLLHDL
jgi:hypothetical protein